MKFIFAASLALAWAGRVQAACSSNLVIDNYSNYANHLNSVGSYTSDDGQCTGLKADTANKKITFTSKSSCYFYTTFACEQATTDGYNAITFPLKGPAGGSFVVELQTSTSCSTTAYKSYFTALSGVTGSSQTFTVPISSFTGANFNAIKAIVFEAFSPAGAWEIGQTQFVCANSQSTTLGTSIRSTSTTSKSSAVSSRISSSSISSRSISSSRISSSSISSRTISSTSKSSSLITSTVRSTSKTSSAAASSSIAPGTCSPLLVDDFASQSRLTFLFYNALLQPTSDDGSMAPVSGRADTSTSVIVSNNHLTLTPASGGGSYWYTMFGCLKASKYGGVGMTIKAPQGTTLGIELQTDPNCNTDNPTSNYNSSADLQWTFDGTEKYYQIPFSKFPNLDADHLISLLFSSLSKAITIGPIALYCGTTGSAYPIPSTAAVIEPSATIPATVGPSSFVIDTFANANTNTLGFYHGGDDTTAFKIASSKLTINTKGDSDLSWYTQIANGCTDFTANDNGYLHIAYTGSNAFTIALQQHNPTCNPNIQPSPYTWDSVEASRYSNSAKTDIYVPISHFNINRKLSIGFALKGFFTADSSVFSKIEIVNTVPSSFLVPSKLPTAPLIFACTRPNSFAFAIDDGDPSFAQRVVSAISAADIKVTFFTVGAPLLDSANNLTNVYKGMLAAGHQVAYHSYTHPPMEGLPTLAAIDWEINQDIDAVQKTLGISSTYFRPPFGTEGARIRQRLAATIPGSKFVAWSVDVQDYLWALSSTPQNQLTAFQSDVNKGGNLVVMHYLYDSTVTYLPQFIAIAKATGKKLMRVDQCLEDPNAPPL